MAICAWPWSGVPGGNDPKGELPGLGIEMLMGLLLETASVGHDAAINASVSVDQLCSDSDFGVYLIIRRRGSTSSIAGLGEGRIKSRRNCVAQPRAFPTQSQPLAA